MGNNLTPEQLKEAVQNGPDALRKVVREPKEVREGQDIRELRANLAHEAMQILRTQLKDANEADRKAIAIACQEAMEELQNELRANTDEKLQALRKRVENVRQVAVTERLRLSQGTESLSLHGQEIAQDFRSGKMIKVAGYLGAFGLGTWLAQKVASSWLGRKLFGTEKEPKLLGRWGKRIAVFLAGLASTLGISRFMRRDIDLGPSAGGTAIPDAITGAGNKVGEISAEVWEILKKLGLKASEMSGDNWPEKVWDMGWILVIDGGKFLLRRGTDMIACPADFAYKLLSGDADTAVAYGEAGVAYVFGRSLLKTAKAIRLGEAGALRELLPGLKTVPKLAAWPATVLRDMARVKVMFTDTAIFSMARSGEVVSMAKAMVRYKEFSDTVTRIDAGARRWGDVLRLFDPARDRRLAEKLTEAIQEGARKLPANSTGLAKVLRDNAGTTTKEFMRVLGEHAGEAQKLVDAAKAAPVSRLAGAGAGVAAAEMKTAAAGARAAEGAAEAASGAAAEANAALEQTQKLLAQNGGKATPEVQAAAGRLARAVQVLKTSNAAPLQLLRGIGTLVKTVPVLAEVLAPWMEYWGIREAQEYAMRVKEHLAQQMLSAGFKQTAPAVFRYTEGGIDVVIDMNGYFNAVDGHVKTQIGTLNMRSMAAIENLLLIANAARTGAPLIVPLVVVTATMEGAIHVYKYGSNQSEQRQFLLRCPPWLLGLLGTNATIGESAYGMLGKASAEMMSDRAIDWNNKNAGERAEMRSKLLFVQFLEQARRTPALAGELLPAGLAQNPAALDDFYAKTFVPLFLPTFYMTLHSAVGEKRLPWKDIREGCIAGRGIGIPLPTSANITEAELNAAMAQALGIFGQRTKTPEDRERFRQSIEMEFQARNAVANKTKPPAASPKAETIPWRSVEDATKGLSASAALQAYAAVESRLAEQPTDDGMYTFGRLFFKRQAGAWQWSFDKKQWAPTDKFQQAGRPADILTDAEMKFLTELHQLETLRKSDAGKLLKGSVAENPVDVPAGQNVTVKAAGNTLFLRLPRGALWGFRGADGSVRGGNGKTTQENGGNDFVPISTDGLGIAVIKRESGARSIRYLVPGKPGVFDVGIEWGLAA